MKPTVCLLALFIVVGLAGCDEAADDRPYFEFVGGGFIFNYNLAQAYYGFVARAERPAPAGTILEAEFEDPAGGPAFLVEQPVRQGGVEYSFRSPAVKGVKADRPYQVVLRVIEPEQRTVIATYSKAFRSTADQDILPEKPLTVGPGYQPNPESEYANPPEKSPGG